MQRDQPDQLILQSIQDFAIFTCDPEGRINYWNPGAQNLFGYEEAEAIGQSIAMLFTAEDRARGIPEAERQSALDHGCAVDERWHTRSNGTSFFVSGSLRPMRRPDGVLIGFTKVARDITERKRLEELLRSSEEQLRIILESATDYAIATLSVDGVIRTWNKGAEKIFGYAPDEMIGRPAHILFTLEDQQIRYDLKEVDLALREGRATNERWQQRKDGTRFWASGLMMPMTDDAGKPVGVLKILRDWTERRNAEQNLERTVMERTAKLREVLGDLEAFSYSIAHDMRAPLRAMQGFANLLQDELAENASSQVTEYVRRIRTSANRLDQLIQDVLNYSKIMRMEVELDSIDPATVIREIIESYPRLGPADADIQIRGPLPRVAANRAALTQVVSNLLGNAVKFVHAGVRPQVTIRAERRDDVVRFWFEDNGIGIPKEACERIFQMLQRVNPRDEYEGTGIGLAIVRKAAERMAGRVGVESELGQGSKFWIELKGADRNENDSPC